MLTGAGSDLADRGGYSLETVPPPHLSVSCDSYPGFTGGYGDKPRHPTPIYLLKGCLHGCVISYIGLSK